MNRYEILLVDDESDALDFLQTVIDEITPPGSGNEIRITSADRRDEGRTLITEMKWDLVVLDLHLKKDLSPDEQADVLNGLELVEHAHQVRRTHQLAYQLFVMTQYSSDQEADSRARQAGADEVFGKHDIDRKTLKKYVSKALGIDGDSGSSGPPFAAFQLFRNLVLFPKVQPA